MPDVTKTIQIVIDATTGKAVSAFKDMKTNVGEAEGAFGKLKAGVSGAGNVLGALPLPAVATAAAGAVGAVISLGNQFEEAALSAKKLSDATGLSVEDASRWQEVAGDVGVSTDQLAGSFGKAVKALGQTPGKFEALGVSVVHAKDGTVDMNATLLNAIGTINSIEDPTKKAALASQLFGKSWQDLTPVLSEGTDQIKQNLAAVSAAKVITDDEVKSAKEWQATMDTLGDTLDDLKLTAGKLVVDGLGPVIGSIAEMSAQVDELINAVDAGSGAVNDIGNAFSLWFKYLSPVGFSLQVVTKATELLGGAVEKLEGPIESVIGFMGDGVKVVGEFASKVEDAATATEHFVESIPGGDKVAAYADDIVGVSGSLAGYVKAHEEGKTAGEGFNNVIGATAVLADRIKGAMNNAGVSAAVYKQSTEEATKALEAQAKALNDEIAALTAQSDAMRAAADSQFAADKAGRDLQEALIGLPKTIDDINKSTDDNVTKQLKIQQAYDDVALAASDNADAQVRLADDQAKAAGSTLTATQKLDGWNAAMLTSAANADGPLHTAIVNHIAAVNGIPPEKVTEILATTPDLAEQKAKIDEASKNRALTIKADADTEQAGRDIAAFIEQQSRQAIRIGLRAIGIGDGTPHDAAGGPVYAGRPVVVGDAGRAELFVPPSDGSIKPYVPAGGSGGGGGVVIESLVVNGGGPDTAKQIVDEMTWAMRIGRVAV